MNKYIKTDLDNARKYMKVAIMNTLHDLNSGEEGTINLGPYISWGLLYNCLIESGWELTESSDQTSYDIYTRWISPRGINVKIEGSLSLGEFIIHKNI